MEFLNYAGELLPTLALIFGFYLFVRFVDKAGGAPVGRDVGLQFLCGLALGMAPWCKLQAAPMTAGLGLVMLLAIWRPSRRSIKLTQRILESIAFCSGSLFTTGLMLALIAKGGALGEFWSSYLVGNAGYAGRTSLIHVMSNAVLIFAVSPLHQLLLVGIGLLIYAEQGDEVSVLSSRDRWLYGGVLVYLVSSLFAVCRVTYLFRHHAIFLVPPMTYVVAVLASSNVSGLNWRPRSPGRIRAGMLLMVVSLVAALYATYAVEYWQMTKDIRDLSRVRTADVGASLSNYDEATHGVRETISYMTAQLPWVPHDSNERIATVIRQIEQQRAIRTLAIWGWVPGVYVLTGIPPSTRYAVSGPALVNPGSSYSHGQSLFLTDLKAKPPDLFIDAIVPGAAIWREWDAANSGYESDAALRNFVDTNYQLVAELALTNGAKPVRFFVRRDPESK